ncbi:PREDICTED: nuclear pore complex protein Nup50 isoform X2 [Gekko japonicus]|uniref:Nuclear pore complex protein Nup50 isoform X2 n=1 Tax=Gekko japonicus TaxID=146911 RepID=A0ABM1KB91_GEKJA|nr:PREDICTED: nuclear pore complex protein Nup50 isoform X2 [Gekko japonicus]XP_015270978.1 PREDICTED: nuclear pore complex protein Nup50 isoform X2 [Gekko japonicus]
MAKRVAEKELTDRNWDQEEETEEMGTFSMASDDVLKNRAIKKAKRRNMGLESDSGGAFKGFKGFSLSSGAAGFSGFGNGTRTKPFGLSNGSSSVTNTSSLISFKAAAETQTTLTSSVVSSGSMNIPGAEKKPASLETNGESQPPPPSGSTQRPACSSDVYHKQLAALNCSVRDWIVKHVNANPLCDLSPIFRDYEKYLAEIEQHGISSDSGSESDSNKAVGSQPGPTFSSSNLQQSSPFFFSSNKSEDLPGKSMELEKKPEPKLGSKSAVTFTFGKSVNSSGLNSSALPNFSFSSGSASLFGKDASQGSVPSFPSKASETPMESASNEDKGEEEEEPPKVVVNEIKEDDAFYSKKCKIFYKKDNEFKEKGVGTLHLKPAGNQKTQLLVRADTNLGNILLNILVPPNMPCSRTGKNNVLVVCIPNPPIDEKNATVPVPMLIRVKTSEDANELHKILTEKKEEA